MSILKNKDFNPFIGLRSFDKNESHLFFGREKQTQDVIKILGNSGFITISGSSGSGKSSLIKIGIIPLLESRLLNGDT